MSLVNALSISGTGMMAQSFRINMLTANLNNADSAASTPETAYRAAQPIFAPTSNGGVRVAGTKVSQADVRQQYEPDHPLADENGFVYYSNVNSLGAMTDLISASRSYQAMIEVGNTVKDLALRTIHAGA